MTIKPFGTLPSGEKIDLITLGNAAGASVEVMTYGGIIRALYMPDRQGRLADVVLGFDDLASYLRGHPYFGAIIGRIAGRVTGGRLVLPDQVYQLACNNGRNHLHGGLTGLDKRVWSAQPLTQPDGAEAVRLTYHSPDGEEGYPGTIDIAVTYALTAGNTLVVTSEATADRLTPLCLAQHSYFNLAGEGSGPVTGHEVQIHAATCMPAGDGAMTLSGRAEPVAGTGNDFTRARRLGDALPGLFQAHGEFYLFRAKAADAPTPAARVVEPQSGRVLEVSTNEPGMQFYTGVALDGTLTGKSGRAYGPHAGLCLECQGYADGASRPEFGDILIRPGVTQHRTTLYAFSTL
jgi:aldose 1-epimerase